MPHYPRPKRSRLQRSLQHYGNLVQILKDARAWKRSCIFGGGRLRGEHYIGSNFPGYVANLPCNLPGEGGRERPGFVRQVCQDGAQAVGPKLLPGRGYPRFAQAGEPIRIGHFPGSHEREQLRQGHEGGRTRVSWSRYGEGRGTREKGKKSSSSVWPVQWFARDTFATSLPIGP